MNAYRLNYNWYEGEHEDCLIVTKLDSEPFEQLLKAGIAEVSTYPEESMVFNIPKIFTVRCLPQAYSLLKEYLESHECHAIEFFKESDDYFVEDGDYARETFIVRRREKRVDWTEL